MTSVERRIAEFIKGNFPNAEVYVAGRDRVARIAGPTFIVWLRRSEATYTIGMVSSFLEHEFDVVYVRPVVGDVDAGFEEAERDVDALISALMRGAGAIGCLAVVYVAGYDLAESVRRPGYAVYRLRFRALELHASTG